LRGKTDLRSFIALFMALMVLSIPFVAMAQDDVMAVARADAERDAEMDVNGTIWFLAGCLGGLTGLLISYIYTPSPPASRLMGKPPEYVAYYTDFYKEKARGVQTNRALSGCLTFVVVYVALYAALITSASTY
jgi:hypothetical protein